MEQEDKCLEAGAHHRSVHLPLSQVEPRPKLKKKIDLIGHCSLCLGKARSLEGGAIDTDITCKLESIQSSEFASVNFLWHYLRFGVKTILYSGVKHDIPDFLFLDSSKKDQAEETKVPPLCDICYKEVKILRGVHQDWIMIRHTLQEQVKRIQQIILTTDNGNVVSETERWRFEKKLRQRGNQTFIADTLNFLEFIRLGIGKGEKLVENLRTRSKPQPASRPVYPLTACELLFPAESPSSCSDKESYSGTDDEAEKGFHYPEVKIEAPSDVEGVDSTELITENSREESSRNKMHQNHPDTHPKKKRRRVGKVHKAEISSASDSENNKYSNEVETASKSDEEEIESANSDLDSTVDEETLMDATSDSENSDTPENDPLSEFTPKTCVNEKSDFGSTLEGGTKRARGRPRKNSHQPFKKEVKQKSSEALKTTVIVKKPPGQKRSRAWTYHCDKCCDLNLKFSTEKALIRHKVNEHGAEPLRCKTCNEPFYTARTLYRHEKREHPETTPDQTKYFCELCNKSFCSRYYVEHHKKIVHFKEKPFSCEYCDKKFTNQLGRTLHTKAFHLKEKHECSGCGKIFNFRHTLERHQENLHPSLPEVKERLTAKRKREKYDTREERRGRPPRSLLKNLGLDPADSSSGKGNKNTFEEINETEPSQGSEYQLGQMKQLKQTKGDPPSAETQTESTKPRSSENKRIREYRCDLCHDLEPFKNEKSLILHKCRRHGEKYDGKVSCKVCAKTFLTPRQLQYHQRTYHPEIKPDPIRIPCLECDKTFSSQFVMRIHQRVVHRNEKLFECKHCSKTFENKAGLKFHVQAIHLGKRYQCDICEKEFKYETTIKRHKIAVHKIDIGSRKKKERETFTCTECQPSEKTPSFKTDDSLQNHLIVFHDKDPYHCSRCDEKFLWRKQMINHIKNVHEKSTENDTDANEKPKEKPTFTCDQCGKIYLNRENLKLHLMKVHDPDWPKKAQPYTCEICKKSYIHKSGYKWHLKMQHRSKSEHMCHICGQKFRNPYYLARHLPNHTNLRSHYCPHCPARFKRKDTCLKHIRFVHNRVKQRNVGIRRMHFRPLEDDEPSMKTLTSSAPKPSGETTLNASNSATCLPTTSFSQQSVSSSEVKVGLMKDHVEFFTTTPAIGASSNFPNMHGNGFVNL